MCVHKEQGCPALTPLSRRLPAYAYLNPGFLRTHSHELQTSFDKQVTRSAHPFHWRRIKRLERTEDGLHEHAARSLGSEQGTTRAFWTSLIQVSMGEIGRAHV